MGIEPTTPCLQSRCSSQLSYVPVVRALPGRDHAIRSSGGAHGQPQHRNIDLLGRGSVVLQRNGIRGDVHLGLVLGHVDDTAL